MAVPATTLTLTATLTATAISTAVSTIFVPKLLGATKILLLLLVRVTVRARTPGRRSTVGSLRVLFLVVVVLLLVVRSFGSRCLALCPLHRLPVQSARMRGCFVVLAILFPALRRLRLRRLGGVRCME